MADVTQGIKVDGTLFRVPFVSLKRTADFLDKYAERTEDGDLKRELIGVYYNYQLTCGSSSDFPEDDYAAFWEKMTEPTEFHSLAVPDGSGGWYEFKGYISSVSDEYEKILDDENTFKNFTCKFTAKEPSRK